MNINNSGYTKKEERPTHCAGVLRYVDGYRIYWFPTAALNSVQMRS
jgi:hypothetical protein